MPDDAIASAVSEYGADAISPHSTSRPRGSERLGFLAHELRNLVNTAVLAFEVLKTGNGVTGSTGVVLHRNLTGLRASSSDRWPRSGSGASRI
jgi:hypothetical protein